jgi:hypothetical protein
MSVISGQYHDDSGNNSINLGLLLNRAMLNVQFLTVNLSEINTVVTGSTATTTCKVMVRADDETRLDQPITLTWQKEESRQFLFFPQYTWRVTSSSYSVPLSDFPD